MTPTMKCSFVRALVLGLLLVTLSANAAPGSIAPKQYARGEFSFATGSEPDFVDLQSVPDKWPADAATQGAGRWRNWLIDSQFDRRPGADVEYSDRAYEAIAQELVSDAAKFSIGFNPLYQQLTLHRVELRRDGAWSNRFDEAKVTLARRESGFEDNMADGEVTALIVLADVRVGDVVRISYSVKGANPIMAGSLEDTFHMAWVDPMLDRHVRVLFPAGMKISTKSFNTKLAATVAKVGDHQEVLARAHLVTGMRDEGSYPNWYRRYPLIQIAPERSWSDVVRWALPLYPQPDPLPAELQKRVVEWKKIGDPYARTFAALRAVQDEIRYFGTELGDNTHRPAPPALTWQHRYGDCKDKAYLTSTLLHELGIEAEPALVSIDHGKAVLDSLPSAGVFDHVIVRARINGETFWIDPTLTQQRGDLRTLDLRDYGAALPVAIDIAALVPVIAPKVTNNAVTVKERFEPSANGDGIDLQVRTEYSGMRAETMRWRVNSEGLVELSRAFSDYYRKRYSELTVVAPLGIEEAGEGDHLVLVEHYLLKEGWASKLGQVRQIEFYADALSGDAAMPQSIDRTGPLALAHPSVLRQDITLVLPKGWSLVETPDAADIKAAEFAYSRRAIAKPGSLDLSHRMEILADHVPPANVGGYLRSLRQVGDATGTRLSVRTSVGVGDADRNDRLQKLLRDAMENKGDGK